MHNSPWRDYRCVVNWDKCGGGGDEGMEGEGVREGREGVDMGWRKRGMNAREGKYSMNESKLSWMG